MTIAMRLTALVLGAGLGFGAAAADKGASLDPGLPEYVKGSGVSWDPTPSPT